MLRNGFGACRAAEGREDKGGDASDHCDGSRQWFLGKRERERDSGRRKGEWTYVHGVWRLRRRLYPIMRQWKELV